jgi:hypothetical protein
MLASRPCGRRCDEAGPSRQPEVDTNGRFSIGIDVAVCGCYAAAALLLVDFARSMAL